MATSRPRKTQPKLAPVPSRARGPRALPTEPVDLGQINAEPEVLVPVYELDGKTYSMPLEMDPFFALDYQEMLQKEGPLPATKALLIDLFGEEAYADLRRARIGRKGLDAISDRIGQILIEGTRRISEEPTGETAAAGN